MSKQKKKPISEGAAQMEKIVSLCKRRGIIFPSSEIYGGLNGAWDYGPLGVEIKRNIKSEWWRSMVTSRDDVVGLDAAILMNPRVWEASGHLEGFTDPMVDCKKCKHRFKADSLEAADCPDCGGELTDAKNFNLMFKTFVGPVEEDATTVFIRPETAQGIFVNFDNVLNTARLKLPFGIAQIGKAFRNEINPRNFTFRSREFEQMEMEFFVTPGEDEKWYEYWRDRRYNWYLNLGLSKDKLHLRDHESHELAHYAKGCVDVEYDFPFGLAELEGVANRSDYDLKAHAKSSGKRLDYFDEEKKERYTPFVIEPSAGVDRSTLAFIVDAYVEEEERTVLRFHPKIAPIKVGVFPLLRKEGQPEKALEVRDMLKEHFAVFYDQAGAIGRRYRRQDEIGTPFGVTIDHTTAEDGTITLRERDSMAQERVPIENLLSALRDKMDAA
jgi:glycyl-tRNA synthetase